MVVWFLDPREKEVFMNSYATSPLPGAAECSYLLRFASLHDRGRGIAVPCDCAGTVDIDSLTERLRNAYFGARAMVGRDYGIPTVQPSLT